MFHGMRLSPGVGGGTAFPKKEVVIEGLAAKERREIPLREGESLKIYGSRLRVEKITPAIREAWLTHPPEASFSVNIPGALTLDETVSTDRPYRIGAYTIGILDAGKGTATFEVKRL
ncbi:hypothetical protein H0O01_04755 [Candidatus Micrarchaeota archaeon]|nr:hypothetical protein [Candidatus Micrarchaeota archaeon]